MENQKHLFSLDPEVHYLNCAYKSPLLKSAEKAAYEALLRDRNPGILKSTDFFDVVEDVRTLYGSIISCHPANVAIIPSTSYGFASVLSNITGKKNGKGITIHQEFPSGYFALEKWCKVNENNFQVVAPEPGNSSQGKSWNTQILEAIDQNTSVVLMSAIHWMNGIRFDLEAIGKRCKEVGAFLIVDGSQTVGALPIDVEKYQIDALVCASYKWLFGTYSIGLMYTSDYFANGRPLEESWMNRSNAKDFSNLTQYESKYFPSAGRFNVGEASNLITMPILKYGLMQLKEWGVENIQAYCGELIQPLKSSLRKLGITFENDAYFSNHLFALDLPAQMDSELVRQKINENKIIISVRGDSLRVSVNVFNDQENIHALIQVLENV